MFVKNSNQQVNISDPLLSMPQYLIDTLEKSWAHTFQKKIFPMINEERFRVLYSDDKASRPNTPVNVIVGLLILKEMFQITDEELIGSLHFDIRYQYALRTTSFEKQPVSINTLYNFRKRLYEYFKATGIDLIHEEVESEAGLIGVELDIQGKKLRMDSLMISSSCKKLSRIELFFQVNRKCVSYLLKVSPKEIPDHLKRYTDDDYKQDILYRLNHESVEDKLIELLKHSLEIRNCYQANDGELLSTDQYVLIERLINENIDHQVEGDLSIKPGKEMNSNSLQSSSDPDATYREKYGANVGYVGNVVEKFDGKNCVIAYYDYKPNTYSDIKFSEDTVKKIITDETLQPKKGLDHCEKETTTVIVDGTYYGQEMANNALKEGVVFVPTDLVGRKQQTDKMSYIHFELDCETDTIVKCPNDIVPVKSTSKGKYYNAKFNKNDCNECGLKAQCPIIVQKKYNCIKVLKKRYQTEQLRVKMDSTEYRELKKQRAAIEGVPSILRRKYRVDTMPVRRFVRSKIWFGFKIAAINAKKLIKKELAIS